MRTRHTFESSRFQPRPEELDDSHEDYINPGVFARDLADFLESGLRERGISVSFRCSEDWGYWQEIEHPGDFTLALGCSNLDEADKEPTTHHVFVSPSTPTIRPLKRWFRKTDIRNDVERLVDAVGDVLRSDPQITNISLEQPLPS